MRRLLMGGVKLIGFVMFAKVNGGLLLALGSGLLNEKVNRLKPTTVSFVIVGENVWRKLTAMFLGLRNVSTQFGKPGNLGVPSLAVSDRVFWAPLEYRTKTELFVSKL